MTGEIIGLFFSSVARRKPAREHRDDRRVLGAGVREGIRARYEIQYAGAEGHGAHLREWNRWKRDVGGDVTHRIRAVCFDGNGREAAVPGVTGDMATGCPSPTFGACGWQ